MAHQLVLVLITDPHASVIDQVETQIGRHSISAKVEPYKAYFEPCFWDGRHWGEEDAEAFARRREQQLGEKYERDENGVYQWVDENPDAHYDWYTIGGRWDGIFTGLCDVESDETDEVGGRVRGNICPIEALPEGLFPGSFVTPDGEWSFFGWRFGGEDPSPEGIETIRRITNEHKGCYAVAVDAHS